MTHPDLKSLAAELRKLEGPHGYSVIELAAFLRNNAATLAECAERVAALEKELQAAIREMQMSFSPDRYERAMKAVYPSGEPNE